MAFARALRDRGHEVRVLTGFPNYPGGNLYPGYSIRPFHREHIDGVTVYRVPLYPSHNRSTIRRALNYLSFALSAAVAAPIVGKGVDVAYVYHPPATISIPALALRIFRRVPFVYDIQDLWPDTLASTGMVTNRFALSAIDRWMNLVYRSTAGLLVLPPGFKKRLIERGVPAAKVEVIYNWAPEAPRSTTDSEQPWRTAFENRFSVVFAGNMGKAQALDGVLDAAAIVAKNDGDTQFVFIGDGVEMGHLQQVAVTSGLTNTLFLPRMSFSEIADVFAKADALLVHLRDDPLFAITIPSKTQAYLAAGKPILMAMTGDAADLVEQAQAGIRCRPEDPAAIAQAVMTLRHLPKSDLDDMGRRGREFYEEHLAMAVAVDRLETSLREVARRGS